jgi:hypothetical protein
MPRLRTSVARSRFASGGTAATEREIQLSEASEAALRMIHGGEPILSESRCSRCGTLVIGSVPESLIEDEDAHVRECPKRPFGPSPQR